MKHILYYGCGADTGHYLWESDGVRVPGGNSAFDSVNVPWGIDGSFCPESVIPQRWRKSNANGWIIFAWWDYSVDRRPGSNSVFLFKGFECATEDEMLAAAREQFPRVFARQPEVKPATSTYAKNLCQ